MSTSPLAMATARAAKMGGWRGGYGRAVMLDGPVSSAPDVDSQLIEDALLRHLTPNFKWSKIVAGYFGSQRPKSFMSSQIVFTSAVTFRTAGVRGRKS